jgi:hypothetical protein
VYTEDSKVQKWVIRYGEDRKPGVRLGLRDGERRRRAGLRVARGVRLGNLVQAWLGAKVRTLIDFLSSTGATALFLIIEILMRAKLAYSPPSALVANVSYNGFGSGGYVTVGLQYFTREGAVQGLWVLFFELGVSLRVKGSYYWLAGFNVPVLLSDGNEFKDPASWLVVYSNDEPWLPLPDYPKATLMDGGITIEVPLKRYTVASGSTVTTYQDTLVVEIQLEKRKFATLGDAFYHYTVTRAVVEKRVVDQRTRPVNVEPQPTPEPSPAPPTPYVTVKASVAGGCGYVAAVPQLWFYPPGPEVSVPNGSLVVLRAYPCEGCSLMKSAFPSLLVSARR